MKLLRVFSTSDMDVTDELVAPLKYAVNLEEFNVLLAEDRERTLENFDFLKSSEKLHTLRYVNNARKYGEGKQDCLKDLTSLSNFKCLRDLRINMSSIESIDPIMDLDLEILVLPDNKIKNLDFKDNQMQSLKRLDLENNMIEDISSLGSLKNLRTLYLYNNKIEDIGSLSSLEKLEALLINSNQIKDINPIKSLNLKRLYLQSNPLESDYISIVKLMDVNTLKLDSIDLEDYAWMKESVIRQESDLSDLDENNARLYSFENLTLKLEKIGEDQENIVFKNPLLGLESEYLLQDEYNEDYQINPYLDFKDNNITIKKEILESHKEFTYPIYTASSENLYGQYSQPASIMGLVKLLVD